MATHVFKHAISATAFGFIAYALTACGAQQSGPTVGSSDPSALPFEFTEHDADSVGGMDRIQEVLAACRTGDVSDITYFAKDQGACCGLIGNIAAQHGAYPTSRYYWALGCEKSAPSACIRLMEHLTSPAQNAQVSIDEVQRLRALVRAACDNGIENFQGVDYTGKVCASLAFALGQVEPKDPQGAKSYGAKACNLGAAQGCFAAQMEINASAQAEHAAQAQAAISEHNAAERQREERDAADRRATWQSVGQALNQGAAILSPPQQQAASTSPKPARTPGSQPNASAPPTPSVTKDAACTAPPPAAPPNNVSWWHPSGKPCPTYQCLEECKQKHGTCQTTQGTAGPAC